MTMREKIDCRTCGACCISYHDQDAFCNVTINDVKRMGKRAQKHVIGFDPFDMLCAGISGRGLPYAAIETEWRTMKAGPFKGIDICCCVFLRGSVLNRSSCRIYNERPHVCRMAVKPGTKQCKEIRRLLLDKAKELERS